MTPNPSVSTKNPSARKSLFQFTYTLDVKHNTAVCRFGVAKEKREAIKNEMCCVQILQRALVIQK